MFDLKNLEIAKQQSRSINSAGNGNYDQLYREAIGLLKNYSNSNNGNVNYLKEAAEKLLAAVKIVKRNPQPYLYLSYIFYILGDSGLSQKYLKVSSMIDPGVANTAKLKKILFLESSVNHMNKSDKSLKTASQVGRINRP